MLVPASIVAVGFTALCLAIAFWLFVGTVRKIREDVLKAKAANSMVNAFSDFLKCDEQDCECQG